MTASSGLEARVRRSCEVATPHLVPEVRLHLITPACALWSATEAEAEAAGVAEPFWAFAWPGGQALARLILDRPELVRGRTVLDFGGGSGIEAIAAAKAGAARVWASDVDPLAAAAMRLNAEMNGVVLDVTTDDLVGRDVDAEVVLAGDVTYEPELSRRVIAWLERLARKERTVRVADPGRGFADFVGWTEVARYDAPSDVDVDGRHSVTTRVMGWGLD